MFKTYSSCFFLALTAACASMPDNSASLALNPYDYYAFDRLSRIEITQNMTSRETALDLSSAPISASSTDRTNAHERIVGREVDGAERLRNKTQPSDGQSYYFQTQNSFDQQGWVIDNERLRHLESGLLCPSGISIGEETKVFSLQRVIEFDDEGRDVACNYVAADSGDAITVFASYWPDIPIEAHAAGAVQSIRQSYTITGETTLPVVELTAEDPTSEFGQLVSGMETPLAGGFEIGDRKGVSYRTSLWLVKTEGWHVKLRSTYPSADEVTEFLSAVHFMASHLAVRAKNLAEPMTTGTDV